MKDVFRDTYFSVTSPDFCYFSPNSERNILHMNSRLKLNDPIIPSKFSKILLLLTIFNTFLKN